MGGGWIRITATISQIMVVAVVGEKTILVTTFQILPFFKGIPKLIIVFIEPESNLN